MDRELPELNTVIRTFANEGEAHVAQDPHRLAAVDVGKADVHDHQIDLFNLGRLNSSGAVFHRNGIELLVQRRLFR